MHSYLRTHKDKKWEKNRQKGKKNPRVYHNMDKSYEVNYRINNIKYRILFLYLKIQILRDIK